MLLVVLDTQPRRVPAGALLWADEVFAAFEEVRLLKARVEHQGSYPKELLDFVAQMEVKAMAKLGVVIVARLCWILPCRASWGTLRGALRSYPIPLGVARLAKVH